MGSIGRMRSRVEILEVKQDQPDGLGGFVTTREAVATVWANVDETGGSRTLETNRVTNHSAFTVTMRVGSYNLTTNNLLRYEGTDMTITSITKDQDKRFTIAEVYTDG